MEGERGGEEESQGIPEVAVGFANESSRLTLPIASIIVTQSQPMDKFLGGIQTNTAHIVNKLLVLMKCLHSQSIHSTCPIDVNKLVVYCVLFTVYCLPVYRNFKVFIRSKASSP